MRNKGKHNNINLGQTIIIEDTNIDEISNACIKWLFNNDFKITSNNKSNIRARKISIIFAEFFDINFNQIDCNININMLHYDELNMKPLKDSVLYLSLVKYIFKKLQRKVSLDVIKQLSNYPFI